MKTELTEPRTLDVCALITSLIGLWPVGRMKTGSTDRETSALLELGYGVRRALEKVLQFGDRENLSFRLHQASRKVEAPLVTVLACALAMPYRRARGLPYAPLVLGHKPPAAAARHVDRRIRAMPIDDLINELRAHPKVLREPTGDCAPLINQFPAGVMAEALFGLAPKTLFNFRIPQNFRRDEGRSLEELVRCGLERFAIDVIRQYTVMRERNTMIIQLMSEADAAEADIPTSRAGDVATLLAGALFAADGHEVEFIASRPGSNERAAVLRETAKSIYCDFSDGALRNFELVCDGNVHFGHGNNQTLAEKLLAQIALEFDPLGQADARDWRLTDPPRSAPTLH